MGAGASGSRNMNLHLYTDETLRRVATPTWRLHTTRPRRATRTINACITVRFKMPSTLTQLDYVCDSVREPRLEP